MSVNIVSGPCYLGITMSHFAVNQLVGRLCENMLNGSENGVCV